MDPIREQLLHLVRLLSTDEGFEVLAVRRFPGALAMTGEDDDME